MLTPAEEKQRESSMEKREAERQQRKRKASMREDEEEEEEIEIGTADKTAAGTGEERQKEKERPRRGEVSNVGPPPLRPPEEELIDEEVTSPALSFWLCMNILILDRWTRLKRWKWEMRSTRTAGPISVMVTTRMI
jgi:hypothetical protein